jgi:hypothetical protein
MQVEETLQNGGIGGALQHVAQACFNFEQVIQRYFLDRFDTGPIDCHSSCHNHETVSKFPKNFALPQTWDSTNVDA